MNKTLTTLCRSACAALAFGMGLAGCGSGSDSAGTVTVEGDVPIAYVKRSVALSMNPTDGVPSAPGGDLLVREKSSPSAPEYNVTAAITQGRGDASDPEVSYDGKKIVFALRCPTVNTSQIDGAPACTGRWNIWEYDMTVGGLRNGTLRRITSSSQDDDADPAYLPAGAGFVFSSNRQEKARPNQALGQSYKALDEYEREEVIVLHTMDANGGNIRQISFNQSHDRNPVVRPNGDIMFSRWEHVGDRNRFAVFRVKPDGTDMFVLYGAQSPGNSFLHPRDMDPSGPYRGFLASSLMPLSRTQEGGAMMFIDAANYSEHNTPATPSVPRQGGQESVTQIRLSDSEYLSTHGRVTTPYPLWDGTNRVLLAYRPCEVTRAGVVVPCSELTPAELANLNNRQRLASEIGPNEPRNNAPAAYAIWMFNPANQTWAIVASPPAGFMYTDPVALQPRAEPAAAQPTEVDATLAAANMALLEVRSVYDTDGLGRMGEGMLVPGDLPAGCSRGIALTAPHDPLDTRSQVADLVRMKDPADPAYGCAPARLIRVTRAVAPPAGMTGLRSSIGETEMEQQQILGYAPIEPDGSFRIHVPADTPLALAVIDAKGRAIQTHTNWIQVRPGERRTCDGCHSPRRGAAINSGAIAAAVPEALLPSWTSHLVGGVTMAGARTAVDPTLLSLAADPDFSDVWADTTRPGVLARPSFLVRYTGNADPADDLLTTVPITSRADPKRGVINYPEHIQPLWSRVRGVNGAQTCTGCHTDPARLDLQGTTAGTGRLISYEELLLGDPIMDSSTGLPVVRIQDGEPRIERGSPLVETGSGFANSAGGARKSRLIEILFGEDMLAGNAARLAHPTPPVDHSTMLNAAEKRLLVEWADLGGQYYNDPFDPNGGVRAIYGLSEQAFASDIHPILRANCAAACHQAVGDDTTPAGGSFQGNRFVLTGSARGDYGVTLSMISNACDPDSTYLLSRPSAVPHPSGGTTAVLPANSADYQTIAAWIRTGCR